MIVKRGFEYIIQVTEPTELEGSIVEVLEEDEGGYEIGEYYLNVQELYDLTRDTIWWFRAICYDDSDIKYTAGTWMKSVPTVETKDTIVNALILDSIPRVEVYGELIDKGANIVTKRGFRLFKEYRGNLWAMDYYIGIVTGNFSIAGQMKDKTILGGDSGYEIVDYYWLGLFYRDIEEKGSIYTGFDLEEYSRYFGGGILGEGWGYNLEQNDTYLYQAWAENELGRGYAKLGNGNTIISLVHSGELADFINRDYGSSMAYYLPPNNICGTRYADKIDNVVCVDIKTFTTLGGYFPPVDDEQIDENKFEKTVTLGTIPGGATVTRIGIRLGRTKACNELHYFQDGTYGTGGSVTFMVELEYNSTYYVMPYFIVDYGDHEKEFLGMLNYTDPEAEEEYLTNFPVEVTDDLEEDAVDAERMDAGGPSFSYRSILREIKCEKKSEQGLIDYYGRRRSQTISNHLVQTKAVCCVIVTDYLDKFQRLKLKVAVDIDMPIPFEREDVVLLGDGKTKYRANGNGVILFKADGKGEIISRGYILAKIRKIGNINYTPNETIINLELEV